MELGTRFWLKIAYTSSMEFSIFMRSLLSGYGSEGLGTQTDFGFAFNNKYFSDRILKIKIVIDPEKKIEGGDVNSIVERTRKRKHADVVMQREEQVLNCNVLEMEDGLADDEQEEEEVVGMLEESPSAMEMTTNPPGDDEASGNDDSSTNTDYSNPIRLRALYISSPILAVKSRFFYKLFSNGMKESRQRHVTIRIHASEEAALMDLLNFVYTDTLSTTTPTFVLDVLKTAYKFEVASCMRYCSRLLQNYRMTCESALLYLDLPFNISMADEVLPLTNAAKQFLASHFKDLTKFQKKVLNLPLAGIEAVLSSDDLQIASENAVCDFALKWARMHYPKLEERREIWNSRLCHLIRFPCMTSRKLKKVLITCNDFDSGLASKLVFEALSYKAEALHRQRLIVAEAGKELEYRYVERAYKYRPVKAFVCKMLRQQYLIYLILERDVCASLFPSGRVYSQAFHLGGQVFFLSAHCNMDQQSAFHCFGLFLGTQENGSASLAVDYEFAARIGPGGKHVSKYKGNYTFTGGKIVGCRNLFGVAWTTFLAEDSIYFIDGTLHLCAELSVRQ
ncbi:BTB/POZ domain-containing protein POB1-like isoform X2 [Lycium barbarum]|uniref:BTB/POZ domain-containing protein POB1-like isoform X2 n=1 Tax=Lycium barbarum TaxID=112863 RepID=UPI00293E7887|nr:BTB/POZ domain-containing protein POB1-like isoform X2 [Lycium barbarum]